MGSALRPIGSGVCQVDLGNGRAAIIDEQDAEKVSLFRWKADFAGSTYYARGRMRGMKPVSMHRLILCFPVLVVDHINRNGFDNRRCNLRLCTQQQNSCNTKIRSQKKSSSFKGVHFGHGKWEASIRQHGKLLYLGCYSDELTASLAYDVASVRLHGEFGSRNHKDIQADESLIESVNRRISRLSDQIPAN